MKAYKILSVDCWGNARDGFEWNAWHNTGEHLPVELIDKPRSILRWFRENGLLTDASKGRVRIEDDQHNVCICERDGRVLFAVEYGNGPIELNDQNEPGQIA